MMLQVMRAFCRMFKELFFVGMGVGRTCLPFQLDLVSMAHSIFFDSGEFRILALLPAQPPDIPWLRLRDVAPAHNLQVTGCMMCSGMLCVFDCLQPGSIE